jgi:hypothetical protein
MSPLRQIEMSPWAVILFLSRRNSGRVVGDEYESGSAEGDLAGDNGQAED